MKKNITIVDKVKHGFLLAQTAVTSATLPILGKAGGFGETVTINKNAMGQDPFLLMGGAIGIILGLIQLVGLVMAIWGVVQVVQSMQEDGQADKRVKGFVLIASGAVLMGLKVVLQGMGLLA